MASVKTRVAVTGGKYLLTHPRSRLTRFVVRFVARRVGSRLASATHADAIPATRGSRVVTVAGVVVVAGGVVYVVRRSAKGAGAPAAVTVPPPHAPFPAAAGGAAPPDTRDAPPTSPTTSPAAEAAAITALEAEATEVGDGDAALAARVKDSLFAGSEPIGLSVESTAGVVTLRGTVADEDAEVRIVRDAEQVEGVKAVQSELQTAGAEPGAPGDP